MPSRRKKSFNLLKVPKNCSLAVYVSEFEPRPEGPVIRGGAVLKISGNDSAKETLEKALGRLAPAGAESVEIAGQQWHRATPAPNVPIVWGVRVRTSWSASAKARSRRW